MTGFRLLKLLNRCLKSRRRLFFFQIV